MSDIRALLAGRELELGDGAYAERAVPPPSPLEETLRDWLSRLPALPSKALQRFLADVNGREAAVRMLDDDGLRRALRQAAQGMQRQGFADAALAEAFALIREGSRRTLGMRHHDVQLMAGRTLLGGRIAEMATGEGKTLAATLAACTAAAAGAAVHVVTVNDYLAARDAEHNRVLFDFFGFSVGIVEQDMPLDERRRRYGCDITYVSNKELTFDYLKDRIALGSTLRAHQLLRAMEPGRGASPAILRGLHVAIVDEADSVLIDEARTPLIISETLPDDLDTAVYHQAVAMARTLEAGRHFARGRDRDVWLTDQGHAAVAEAAAVHGGIWHSALWRRELMQKALSALHGFELDQHYIVVENKVQIVDEFTGRVMPDRTWERGLHQMIEAKENCEITGQRRTLSQITYQRFFGRYLLLCGMTGTAKEIEPELKRVYDLSVTRIPTHKPSRRRRLADRLLASSDARWQEVARRAVELAGAGRAVLVGTRSVEASELLSRLLDAQGVAHATLNARQDQGEAEAVAQAGGSGRITVATNMAGRGTDIKLSDEVEAAGGLHVILTEFHESARVDRQLFGRAARQGDPGSVEAIVCLEDELFVRYAPWLSRGLKPLWLWSARWLPRLFRALVWYAQSRAERINRRVRLDTVKRDRKWQQALGFVGRDKV
ncbi:preprotein translocase subunit SecA [Chitinimonas koreensis]|uniref:preprotein translocase subunit SecA n=1 Tax=Chitinimonas koreensis TaxID=356302 RepID=UPI00040FC9BC|nr:preprotein translocase subunit SecA [Chitinimonas koreensis]QNM95065.1 preprotein translocase subunit SecA [Chitinimonas koreensis]